MDAKRVLLLCDENEGNIELQKLSYKGRYYYAEALRSLGHPELSATEYEKLKVLPESFNEITKVKRDEFEKLALMLRRINNIRTQVSPSRASQEEPPNEMLLQLILNKLDWFTSNNQVMLTCLEFGWFEFNGQYPWDHLSYYVKRTSEST